MRNRMKNYTSPEEAMTQVVATIRQHLPLIPGVRARDLADFNAGEGAFFAKDYIHLEWDRSWGVGCSLMVALRSDHTEREETRVVRHMRGAVELGWSSTGRGPAEAVAAAALYAQVAQLGCLIESVLARMEIADVTEKGAE